MDKLTTYGATRTRLQSLGYAPCSALNRGAGWKGIDDPGAILLSPQHVDNASPDASDRQCVALIITTNDKDARSALIEVLAKHRLAGGPVRTDSAGGLTYLIRWDEREHALTRESAGLALSDLPAVVLVGAEDIGTVGRDFASCTVAIGGDWKNSPLSTPRSKLPALDKATLDRVWYDLTAIVSARAEAPPEMSQYLREHYEAGVYQRKEFVAPVYDPIGTPLSAPRERARWYDGFAREWVEGR